MSICSTCKGSGVGMNGPVESSKCTACKGSGAELIEIDGEFYTDDEVEDCERCDCKVPSEFARSGMCEDCADNQGAP